uniref:Reverse transcriptase domain-containing protein n=1 Tax=Tanacetum cinerariifolium TaxID=118510 RepID=A0A6L2N006_TANCI|nr:reverse transcriptase domain-containing protein [Tanacetum cinerariifolium]
MSTRSSARNLVPPLEDPERTVRRRNRGDLALLINFEEINMANKNQNNHDQPPPEGPNVPAADLRTMEGLCEPTLNGQGGPIAPISIHANDFRLKHHTIQQVQNFCQFHGLPGDDANKHLDKFLHITQSMKQNGVTDDALRLYLFPYSLTHHATACFDRFPKNSILSFDQMATKFLSKYFPPSMVTKHRDTINAAAGGTFMKRRLEECYDLIENMTAHHNDWDTTVQRVDSVTPSCKTCGDPHSYHECQATGGHIQNVYAAGTYNQGGNSYQPQGNRNFLSYCSDNYLGPPRFNVDQNQNRNNQNQNYQNRNHGNNQGNNQGRNQFFQGASQVQNLNPNYQALAYQAPIYQPQILTTSDFSNYIKANDAVVERVPEVTKDTMQPSTENIQPLVVQTQVLIDEPVVIAPKLKLTMTYPSRINKHKLHEKDDNLALKFVESFRKLHFDLSFADALLHMPTSTTMFKSLLNNKEKLFDLATTSMNENCSAVILKKLPEKLGDPGKFLIPCDFPKLVECLALADLGASINLMPPSIWEKLSLPELTPTQMILELADRSTTRPAGIAEDVFVKVGKFYFLTDFVVDDYVVNPWVPLILERPFLRTMRALIDVYACEEYLQEVPGFLKISKSGNPTLVSDSIVAPSSPTLTPFGDSNFLLEETDAFLASEDDSISLKINDSYYDTEGDIRLLEEFLNDDPSS